MLHVIEGNLEKFYIEDLTEEEEMIIITDTEDLDLYFSEKQHRCYTTNHDDYIIALEKIGRRN